MYPQANPRPGVVAKRTIPGRDTPPLPTQPTCLGLFSRGEDACRTWRRPVSHLEARVPWRHGHFEPNSSVKMESTGEFSASRAAFTFGTAVAYRYVTIDGAHNGPSAIFLYRHRRFRSIYRPLEFFSSGPFFLLLESGPLPGDSPSDVERFGQSCNIPVTRWGQSCFKVSESPGSLARKGLCKGILLDWHGGCVKDRIAIQSGSSRMT